MIMDCLENIWPFIITARVRAVCIPDLKTNIFMAAIRRIPLLRITGTCIKETRIILAVISRLSGRIAVRRHLSGAEAGIGSSYKKDLTEPGPWMAGMYMQGETIPRESNHVRLSKDLKDPWGIPQLITSIDYDDNAEKMVVDFMNQSSEMLEKAGVKMFIRATRNRRRDWISTRWADAVWAAIRRIHC